jgi:hypothetical protein
LEESAIWEFSAIRLQLGNPNRDIESPNLLLLPLRCKRHLVSTILLLADIIRRLSLDGKLSWGRFGKLLLCG